MKIAVVCANGKAGKLIVKEALDRNLDVTAIVRGETARGKESVDEGPVRPDQRGSGGLRRGDRRLRRLDGRDAAPAQHVRSSICAIF